MIRGEGSWDYLKSWDLNKILVSEWKDEYDEEYVRI